MDLIAKLAEELKLRKTDVEAAVKLIDEGNTIPFIARYRKEATGGMDDVALRALEERLSYLRNLEERKQDVIALIDAQGKLTDELRSQIAEARPCSACSTCTSPSERSASPAPRRRARPDSSRWRT